MIGLETVEIKYICIYPYKGDEQNKESFHLLDEDLKPSPKREYYYLNKK